MGALSRAGCLVCLKMCSLNLVFGVYQWEEIACCWTWREIAQEIYLLVPTYLLAQIKKYSGSSSFFLRQHVVSSTSQFVCVNLHQILVDYATTICPLLDLDYLV
jgi:hypothetical protein